MWSYLQFLNEFSKCGIGDNYTLCMCPSTGAPPVYQGGGLSKTNVEERGSEEFRAMVTGIQVADGEHRAGGGGAPHFGPSRFFMAITQAAAHALGHRRSLRLPRISLDTNPSVIDGWVMHHLTKAMARIIGQRGGWQTSYQKVIAARKNGRLGGRPRRHEKPVSPRKSPDERRKITGEAASTTQKL